MTQLAKAVLQELNGDLSDVKSGGKTSRVQFNPETLKLSFSNHIQTPGGAGDQANGSSGRQYVGAGTTKLSLMLWFDVSVATDDAHRVDDVRRLTQEVVYFMTAQQDPADPGKVNLPGVRFLWGSFKFDGLVDSLEENLEFFSSDGRPLRASVSLGLSQQKILKAAFPDTGRLPGLPFVPGTRPLAQSPAGGSVQSLASDAGRGGDWQRIAESNGIENPRMLSPGQLLDLNLPRP